jgi:Uma2 family endonuclease
LYKAVEVAEYWLVDWRKKQVEIYLLVTDESSIDTIDYKLVNVITNDNKEDLKIHVFPNVNITFEELFDGIE